MAFHAVPVKGLHLLGCKAVGAHKFHGFSAQNIYAVVCTAAHEHLHKSGVVADSGDKTCSARFKCRRLLLVKNAEVVTCVREISLFRAVIYLSKSALLFGRNIEARVLHAQRSKYFLFQKFAELHSRNSLDNSAHNIGRSAVLPPCTGSERQRLFAHFKSKFTGVQKLSALFPCVRLLTPQAAHFLTCLCAVGIKNT